MSDVRVCARDHEPLVFTFEFSGFEYVCVVCGGHEDIFGMRARATVELAARHAALTDRYEIERAERTGRRVPAPAPQDVPAPICQGCGRIPSAEEGRLDHQGKPSLWFARTIDGVTEYACQSQCIKEGARSPW